MPLRYYVTFLAAIVLLQLLTYGFVKTVIWLANLQSHGRRWLTVLVFVAINSLIGLAFLRKFGVDFKFIALVMTLLLFSFFASAVVFCLQKIIGSGRNHWPKATYLLIFAGLLGLGWYNAHTPKLVSYDVKINKPFVRPIRVGLVSDLHLGRLVGAAAIDKLVRIFQEQQVDVIVLAGDIIDDTLEGYESANLQQNLRQLQAPLGVYAALGNHDYMVEPDRIRQALGQAGLKVLEDESVYLNSGFYLIGRKDDVITNRKSAEQLLQEIDSSKPVFMLQHRPSEFEHQGQLPIDLQLAGHTHKGQIFPANLITKIVHFMDYGIQKIGQGNYIVTSGFGFWAVPFRLGSQSEVVIVNVQGS